MIGFVDVYGQSGMGRLEFLHAGERDVSIACAKMHNRGDAGRIVLRREHAAAIITGRRVDIR
jgi:hypothetical protein